MRAEGHCKNGERSLVRERELRNFMARAGIRPITLNGNTERPQLVVGSTRLADPRFSDCRYRAALFSKWRNPAAFTSFNGGVPPSRFWCQ